MIIKILPGEYLINENGNHVCDENGFAIISDTEINVEVIDNAQEILNIIEQDRLNRGLDRNGLPIVEPEPAIEQPEGEVNNGIQ